MQCESGLEPYATGTAAKVGVDISYWQINSYYWEEALLKLNWDIYTPSDNLEAGFYLLSKYGTEPWNWSAKCWNI